MDTIPIGRNGRGFAPHDSPSLLPSLEKEVARLVPKSKIMHKKWHVQCLNVKGMP